MRKCLSIYLWVILVIMLEIASSSSSTSSSMVVLGGMEGVGGRRRSLVRPLRQTEVLQLAQNILECCPEVVS